MWRHEWNNGRSRRLSRPHHVRTPLPSVPHSCPVGRSPGAGAGPAGRNQILHTRLLQSLSDRSGCSTLSPCLRTCARHTVRTPDRGFVLQQRSLSNAAPHLLLQGQVKRWHLPTLPVLVFVTKVKENSRSFTGIYSSTQKYLHVHYLYEKQKAILSMF